MWNPVRILRVVGAAEAVSYLLLLGVAMPLKYLAGQPEAVRVIGALHGGLFVLFVGVAIWCAVLRRWPLELTAQILASSLYPFGPFLYEGRLRREEAESRDSSTPPAT